MKANIIIGLLGLIAGLLIASLTGGREIALAQGGAAMANSEMIAVSLNNQAIQRDMLAVIDTRHKRVALYDFKDSNKLSPVATRNMTYDFQIEGEFIYQGKHLTPSEVKKEIEKQAKEKEKEGPK